ncbi:hypothetical protein N7523_006108 [Penicillium sp. IBT 18751x]|nr:hypothetical protein N7523_006108 [Penicillium sp. IBT 18751x]
MRISLKLLQPSLVPYVCGDSWNGILTEAELPSHPILSVCKLNLRAGTNVHQGDQAADRMWAASVDYIRSIPDCTAFYWAFVKDEPETLIALLQWENVSAWRSFQSSIGFRLMTAILIPGCLNRALPIKLPDRVTPGDIVEMVPFQVAATESTTDFTSSWAQFTANAQEANDPRWIVSGGWLERDGPYRSDSQEQKALADQQPNVFLALLFYKDSPLSASALPSSLYEGFSLLSRFVIGPSILTTPLRCERVAQPMPDLAAPSQPLSCNSMSRLLKIHPPRFYRRDNGFWRSQDRTVLHSSRDQWAGKRLFPGPQGIYSAMGNLNQYLIPYNSHVKRPTVHDVFLFRPMKKEKSPILEALELEKFCGAWTTPFANSEIRARQLPQILNNLQSIGVIDCYSMATPEEWSYGLWSVGGFQFIELVSFYVRPRDADKLLFESACADIIDSMTPQGVLGSPPNASFSYGGGWDISPMKKTGTDVIRFNTVIAWSSAEGMEEWYSDFANGAMQSYERLGHIIDRLQLVTVDVESVLFHTAL